MVTVYHECIHDHLYLDLNNTKLHRQLGKDTVRSIFLNKAVDKKAQGLEVKKEHDSPDSYIYQMGHPQINIHPGEPKEQRKEADQSCTSFSFAS